MSIKKESKDAILSRSKIAIAHLWKDYEREKNRIMTEEFDKDLDAAYPFHECVYFENYEDHWRVEELLAKTYKEEDEIYTFYGNLISSIETNN